MTLPREDLNPGKRTSHVRQPCIYFGRTCLSLLLLLPSTGAKTAVVNHRGPGGSQAPLEIQAVSTDVMFERAHGTCVAEVQAKLRWGASRDMADEISCFNRHYAEPAGSWALRTDILRYEEEEPETTFYDSVTGKPLFRAPRGRTWEDFVEESRAHGWPSFRDEEIVPGGALRVLEDGEVVSEDGTHLGHNLPDGEGNRYCINLVSVAGYEREPGVSETVEEQDQIADSTYENI